MSDKIADAICALRGRDADAYRKARAAYYRAETDYETEGKAIAEVGRAPYRTLEAYMVRMMKPHRIEWDYTPPSDRKLGGLDVDHRDYSVGVHMSGKVWTNSAWRSRMAAHVVFSISPHDADEFLRQVAILKAGVNAMWEAGL